MDNETATSPTVANGRDCSPAGMSADDLDQAKSSDADPSGISYDTALRHRAVLLAEVHRLRAEQQRQDDLIGELCTRDEFATRAIDRLQSDNADLARRLAEAALTAADRAAQLGREARPGWLQPGAVVRHLRVEGGEETGTVHAIFPRLAALVDFGYGPVEVRAASLEPAEAVSPVAHIESGVADERRELPSPLESAERDRIAGEDSVFPHAAAGTTAKEI